MIRAQEAAGFAKIHAVLRNDRILVVLPGSEVRQDVGAQRAANRLITQEFEQRLAMNEPEARPLEREIQVFRRAGGHDLVQQRRVLALPLLPNGRILEYARRDELFVAVRTVQGNLHAIGRLAHETSVTDGISIHASNPPTKFELS